MSKFQIFQSTIEFFIYKKYLNILINLKYFNLPISNINKKWFKIFFNK